MMESVKIGDATLYLGDCLDVLKTIPESSIDSIVCDPPYGLSFMGKKWDYDVPNTEVWVECLRVLKPGGHLLAFAGTRTQHRMAVRIEDAGFEIRDMIAWVYGSGFPKSLDVSKAIDKAGGDALAWRAFSEAYAAAVSSSALTHSDIDRALGIKSSSCYWARTDHRGGMPPRHHWEKVRDLLALPAEFAGLYDEAEREVVGQKTSGIANKTDAGRHTIGASSSVVVDITAPATETARQWQGWGTALKPALEPITVARKPLGSTVAECVLEHGTGAMNIDGCRVAGQDGENFSRPVNHTGLHAGWDRPWKHDPDALARERIKRDEMERKAQRLGRWPANLIHDGSEEVLAAFPLAMGQQGRARTDGANQDNNTFGALKHITKIPEPRGDTGSAARFFYCAKASKLDRDEGLEGFQEKFSPTMGNGIGGKEYDLETATPKRNVHPTVKPTDLMRYLCRLVTPPGGLIMDHYMGSGSTGKAAILENFKFIGIEREIEYLNIAKTRIEKAGHQSKLDQAEKINKIQETLF